MEYMEIERKRKWLLIPASGVLLVIFAILLAGCAERKTEIRTPSGYVFSKTD